MRSPSSWSRRHTSCCPIQSADGNGTPDIHPDPFAPASPPLPDHARPMGAGRGPIGRRNPRAQMAGAPARARRTATARRRRLVAIPRHAATRGRPARSHGGRKAAHARTDANRADGARAMRRPMRASRAALPPTAALRGPPVPAVRRGPAAPRRAARPGRLLTSRPSSAPRTSTSTTDRAVRPGRWQRGPTSGAATRICRTAARSATRARFH